MKVKNYEVLSFLVKATREKTLLLAGLGFLTVLFVSLYSGKADTVTYLLVSLLSAIALAASIIEIEVGMGLGILYYGVLLWSFSSKLAQFDFILLTVSAIVQIVLIGVLLAIKRVRL